MYIHYPGNSLGLRWTIYRGLSRITEDFESATLTCFLFSKDNKFPVEATVMSAADGGSYLYIELSSELQLPDGIYGVSAIWKKNEDRSIARSMREGLFSVVNNQDEATDQGGAANIPVLKFHSSAGTFGYDGLSAYELALLKGLTAKSETEWVQEQLDVATDQIFEAKDEAVGQAETAMVAAKNAAVSAAETAIGESKENALDAIAEAIEGLEVHYDIEEDKDTVKDVQLKDGQGNKLMPITNVENLQGVDDVPTSGSENLVKSGGIFNALSSEQSSYTKSTLSHINRAINRETNKIVAASDGTTHIYFAPVKQGNVILINKYFAQITWASYIIVGFTQESPNTGVDVNEVKKYDSSTHIQVVKTAPYDGYIVINMYNNNNNLELNVSILEILKESIKHLSERTDDIEEQMVVPNIFFGKNLIADKSNSRKGGYNADGTWAPNDGGSSAKYYVTDYIDVTNISSLRVLGYTATANRLLVIAFNESKEVILSNSVVCDRIINTRHEIIWTKLSGTKYVEISYNSDYENYCYEADSKHEVDKLKLGINTDNRNLLDVYGLNNHYGLLDDGTLANLGGSSGTYAVSGYINVVGINKLRIKGYAYVSTRGYLNLAAYNEQLIFIENKSVKGLGRNEFIWENDGTVSYIRIGYQTDVEHYCYICSVFSDYTDKNKIKDFISPDDPQIVRLNDKPNMLLKLQNMKFAKSNQNTPLTLLHFSDIHGDQHTLERLISFKNYYSDYIDDIINTGDTVNNVFSDDYTWYLNTIDANNILSVIGNHENAAYIDGELNMDAKTSKECYDKFIAPIINNWNVTQPSDAASLGKCYYYKDYDASKIRLICVDVMHYDTTENDWLSSVLTSVPSNYSVVIIAHNTPEYIENIKSSFTSVLFVQYGVSWSNCALMWQTVQNFIDNDGKFICYLTGHSHSDAIAVGRDYPKQLIIQVGTANGNILYEQECNRIKFNKLEDNFNIVSFDTHRNIIRIAKVGCNYNAAMQHKDALSIKIDYNSDDKYTILTE